MRYSIMLQLVGLMTLVLLTTAALFAWLQNRSVPSPNVDSHRRSSLRSDAFRAIDLLKDV